MSRLIVVLTLALCAMSTSASLPPAKPPITEFRPDLDVYPQNFAITTDNASRIFIGNSDGVLIYDGEYWDLVPTINGHIVRSLAYDGSDRIYVGGYDAFGYLTQDETGKYQYRDLTTQFKDFLGDDLFADIWHIGVSPQGIFFVALQHLFLFEPISESIKGWKHEGKFGPIASLNGRTYLQWRGQGIQVYEEDQWREVPGPESLSSRFLVAMVTLEDRIIGVSPEESWFQFDGVTFEPLPSMDDLTNRAAVTNARKVDSNNLVLTTQLGKVIFTNLETGEANVIDVARDFLPEAALSPTGDTLVVDNLGFYSVHWPARWRQVGSDTGLAGSVKRVMEIDGTSYVLTSSGIFTSSNGAEMFSRSSWTDYEAWDLLLLPDNSLLLADSYAIKHIKGDEISLVDDKTTARIFLQSELNPDLIYVGTELGFQVLRKDGDTWVVIYTDTKMDNLRINKMLELSATEILISSERAGIQKLDIAQIDSGIVNAYRYGVEDGLHSNNPTNPTVVSRVDSKIVASTDAGLFTLENNTFIPETLEGLTEILGEGTVVEFVGDQWAYAYDRLFKKNGHWYEEDISALSEGSIETVSFLDQHLVVGGLGNILIFDSKGERPSTVSPPVTLTSAALQTGSESSRALPLDQITISTNDRLTLRYAVADFSDPENVRYRTRLEPNEIQYSDWSSSSEQSLVALSPGEYIFRVEGKDSLNQTSRIGVPVIVEPQWFETLGFRTGIAILLFLTLYVLASLAARRRSKLLALERDRLEVMVSERTRALESANQQLDQMAHLDGLTQIPNRRRLDNYLDDVWRQCVDRNRMMAIAIIDVDHFKNYNDTHGHQAGDELLVKLAETFSSNLRRAEDLVARYGGEEFLVVMPGAEEPTARQVIEEMRKQVEESDLGVTVSAGIHANTPHNAMPLKEMVETADRALYQSKSDGRNRVTLL